MWSTLPILAAALLALSTEAALYQPLKSVGLAPSVADLYAENSKVGKLVKRNAVNGLSTLSPDRIRQAVSSGDLSFLRQIDAAVHQYIVPANISAYCAADILFYLHGLYEFVNSTLEAAQCSDCSCLPGAAFHAQKLQRYRWVLDVIDASAKIAPGVLRGNLFMLGNYEQCVQVAVPKDSQSNAFEGKYCRADFKHAVSEQELGDSCNTIDHPSNLTVSRSTEPIKYSCPKNGLVFKVGLCVPNSCTSLDINQILTTVLQFAEQTSGVTMPVCNLTVTCHEKQLPFDTAALVMMVILSILAGLMAFGTAYDYWVYQATLTRVSRSSSIQSRSVLNGSAPAISRRSPARRISRSELKRRLFSHQAVFVKVLLAFSVYTNAKKIFDTGRKPGQVHCVHGIRFLSMTWVILGHTYYWSIGVLDNLKAAYDLPKRLLNQVVLNATVCVDAFYVLEGLLLVYLVLKDQKKSNGESMKRPAFWAMFYLHRFIRLTPVYALILGVDVALFRYFADGPLWNQNGVEPNFCRRSWWTNILYVNNFFVLDELCMSWTWYLANAFQFYACTPPILYLLFKREKVGVAVIAVLIVLSGIIRALIVILKSWPPTSVFSVDEKQFDIAEEFWNQFYIKPYCRCQPYLIGMLLGFVFYKNGCQKLNLSKAFVSVGWCLAIAGNCGVLFGLFEYSRTGILPAPVWTALYAAFQRAVWAFGLAWMIYACVSGYGGFINQFLSWKVWVPLSKITYCAYLVHPLIVYGAYTSRFTPLHIDSQLTLIYHFLAHCSISFVVAFLFSIAFEIPILALEELIFHRPQSTNKAVENKELVEAAVVDLSRQQRKFSRQISGSLPPEKCALLEEDEHCEQNERRCGPSFDPQQSRPHRSSTTDQGSRSRTVSVSSPNDTAKEAEHRQPEVSARNSQAKALSSPVVVTASNSNNVST